MVASVYHRIAADLRADAEMLDRECVTRYFMAFSSKWPLQVSHPRTGTIFVGSFAFCAESAQAYDRFTQAVIEDFLERHLRACEDGLESVPDEKLDAAISELAGLLYSFAVTLGDRQAKLKRRLLKNPDLRCSQLFQQNMRSLEERLAIKVADVRAMRCAQGARLINFVSVENNHGALQVGTVDSIMQVDAKPGDAQA